MPLIIFIYLIRIIWHCIKISKSIINNNIIINISYDYISHFNCLNIIQSLFTKRKLQLKRKKEKENEILDISEKIIIKVEI